MGRRGRRCDRRVVYANYGRLEDFDELEKQHIDLHGKIVMVRYGATLTAVKVRARSAPSLSCRAGRCLLFQFIEVLQPPVIRVDYLAVTSPDPDDPLNGITTFGLSS